VRVSLSLDSLNPHRSTLKHKGLVPPEASSKSTHATPFTFKLNKDDHSDNEDAIRQIIEVRRMSVAVGREEDSAGSLESLRKGMQTLLSQDKQYSKGLELRRRHIKNQLLSAFV
jgi:hypothetical protein